MTGFHSALKQVETDLKGVHSAIKSDASVQDFLSNPVLSSADKTKGIAELLKKASPKGASDVTKNFFEVLAENGRLYQSSKTIEDFLEIMTAHRGEVKVVITSAVPLEKDLQKRLEEALKSSQIASAGGKTLVFENRVNEALQGGFTVELGDRTIDLSVASKVNKLNAQLAESV
jgi:F-type H+-transporting ATPase subunit O